jgi:hypothetical protein
MKTVEQRRKGYGLISKLIESRKEAIRLGNDENKGYLNEEEIKKFLHLKDTLDINPNKSDNEIKQDIKEDNEAIKNKEFDKYGDVKEFNGISLAGGEKNEAEEELSAAGKEAEEVPFNPSEEGEKPLKQLSGPVAKPDKEKKNKTKVETVPAKNKGQIKPTPIQSKERPEDIEDKEEGDIFDRLGFYKKPQKITFNKELATKVGDPKLEGRMVELQLYRIDKDPEKVIQVARTVDDPDDNIIYVLYNNKNSRFTSEKDWQRKVKEILDNTPIKKSFNIEKQGLLNRIESLVNVPMPNPALPVENEINGFKVFSQFQSGANKVTLEGKDNEYKVCTNGIESTNTEDFREALAKYYSSVSRVIDTQNEDKDLGLEMFGEHVLSTARKTRKLMADLDKSYEADMLGNLDYGELEMPFNPDFILKYEPDPIIKADPTGDFFGIVPITNNSEDTQCEAEYGDKIGKKDLKEDEYHGKNSNRNKKQEAITEDTADGIQPGIISNSLNQPQMLPTRQEENLRNEPIEKPYRVNGIIHQRNLHPKQNRVNEGNRGVDGG